MTLLILAFVITLVSGLVSVTGGNGLILMPGLLMANLDIKEVMVLVRVSAVVFVIFNLFAMFRIKEVPSFDRKDFLVTLIACLSVFASVLVLTKLGDTTLMLVIAIILSSLFLFITFKPKKKSFSCIFTLILPIFSGVCGSVVGGAGMILSILYLLLGYDHTQAVKKRIVPSLAIQIVSFVMFMSQDIAVNKELLFAIIIATAISGYLNMKIYMQLSKRTGKIIFYASFIFSIFSLLEDFFENILNNFGMGWVDLTRFVLNAH